VTSHASPCIPIVLPDATTAQATRTQVVRWRTAEPAAVYRPFERVDVLGLREATIRLYEPSGADLAAVVARSRIREARLVIPIANIARRRS